MEEVCPHHKPSAKDDIIHLEGAEGLVDAVVLAATNMLLHWILFTSWHAEATVSTEDIVTVPRCS